MSRRPSRPESFSYRLLPACCALCATSAARSRDLCENCENDLRLNLHACSRCGIPLAGGSSDTCGQCLHHPPPQQLARVPFVYEYPLDSLVQRFKFHADQAAGRVLAELMAAHVVRTEYSEQLALLPVPLHPSRLKERGFNQAAVLAAEVSRVTGHVVDEHAVARIRNTAVQSGMPAAARKRNIRGAFACTTTSLPARVAIIDDVITTGSTTQEIAKLLLLHGVEHVETWALARTP